VPPALAGLPPEPGEEPGSSLEQAKSAQEIAKVEALRANAQRAVTETTLGSHGMTSLYLSEPMPMFTHFARAAERLACHAASRARATRAAWIAAGTVLTATGLAEAEPSGAQRHFSASLEYTAPSPCPKSSDFKAVVVSRLGFDPFGEDAPVRVFAVISARERPLEGRLEWRNVEGNWTGDQTFRAENDDCEELARTMGLALAVQIHLLASGEEPDSVKSGAEHRDASTTSAPVTPTVTVPAAAEAKADASASSDGGSNGSEASHNDVPWSFAVGGGGSLGLGMSADPTALGRVFATLGYGFLSFELGGEVSTETSEARADGAGFTQRALLASAAACGSQGPFSVCAVAKGGVMKVAGQEVDLPVSSNAAAFQAGLRLLARGRVGRSAFLGARLEGLANVTRWTVSLDGIPVWTAPPVAGTLGIDAGVLFE
jgi:hypothetical protein